MKAVSRRDLLKTSIMVPAGLATAQGFGPLGSAPQKAGQDSEPLPISGVREASVPGAGRERLLLDFGWRFHFGNADDPAKDFGFGSGQDGQFPEDGKLSSRRRDCLRRQRLASRGPAARLGHRAALQERSRACQQGLLSAGTELSGDQRRLVSPRLRDSRRGRGQADHARVRWRLPRDDGGLQRLLHRHATAADTIPSVST